MPSARLDGLTTCLALGYRVFAAQGFLAAHGLVLAAQGFFFAAQGFFVAAQGFFLAPQGLAVFLGAQGLLAAQGFCARADPPRPIARTPA